jgi:hypothetical protein
LDTRVVEVALPNGTTALVRVVDVEGGATKTGFKDKFDLDEVAGTLEGLSDSLKSALSKAAPDRITVEYGIELALKAGKLTSLIVRRCRSPLARLAGAMLIEQTTNGWSLAATCPRSPWSSSLARNLPPRRPPSSPGLSRPRRSSATPLHAT